MPLWVEIISCEFETMWYYEHVGVSFEVLERDDNYYEVIEDNPEKPFEKKLIKKKEAKVIE